MKVYAPIDSAALDWGVSNNDIVKDLQQILDQSKKIAAVPALCTEPYMYCYQQVPPDLDFSQFNLVLISDIEFYSANTIVQWIESKNIKNWVLAIGGMEHNQQIDSSNTVYRPWWVYNCMRFNQFQDTRQKNKPFDFEMLLGARRPHRDFAMLSFQKHNMLHTNLVTYRDVFQGHTIDHCTQQIIDSFRPIELEYPYVSPNLDPAWETQQKINYQISPFVPWEIYRQTNYSVLCETLGMGSTFFMSEKAAKVMLGERVFVAFAAHRYLEYLKQLGFQTFAGIIDESYDQESDYMKRYQMAFAQIQQLTRQDPEKILDQARCVVEHNRQHLQTLKQQTQQAMSRLIENHL
jgi:hypothetical protein